MSESFQLHAFFSLAYFANSNKLLTESRCCVDNWLKYMFFIPSEILCEYVNLLLVQLLLWQTNCACFHFAGEIGWQTWIKFLSDLLNCEHSDCLKLLDIFQFVYLSRSWSYECTIASLSRKDPIWLWNEMSHHLIRSPPWTFWSEMTDPQIIYHGASYIKNLIDFQTKLTSRNENIVIDLPFPLEQEVWMSKMHIILLCEWGQRGEWGSSSNGSGGSHTWTSPTHCCLWLISRWLAERSETTQLYNYWGAS
jgi:hypothetical protein